MIRELTELEKQNLSIIEQHSINSTTLILTETGFNKSIMDATYSVRYFLENSKLHIFKEQQQGPQHKKIIPAKIYHNESFTNIDCSLYRPITKNGDPRIWFLGLKQKKILTSACAFALLESNNKLYLFNLSNSNLIKDLQTDGPLRKLLLSIREEEESIATELFDKIFNLYEQGWIKAVGIGDKAVGETLETALGIKTNSSKKPDYKGIELKSYRKGKKGKTSTRSNLFAQVANWSLSKLKSSQEMLDKHGYFRDGKTRLNCTVSSIVTNSQGLRFQVSEKDELLHEVYINKGRTEKCLAWSFQMLINRTKAKHSETFWVEAQSRLDINGNEEFLYTGIIHTKSPFLNKLIPLIEDGTITMDHLISSKDGKAASERGPLFKIDKRNLGLLFPDPNVIDLTLYKR